MHELFKELKPYLELSTVMVVSTSKDDKPYSCTVFYSFDEDLNLYFLSTKLRRHSREVLKNKNVSIAVSEKNVEWGSGTLKGLQVEGECVEVPLSEVSAPLNAYIKRFPNSSSVRNEFEEHEGAEDDHYLWKVTPKTIKVWDEAKYAFNGKLFTL